MHHRTEYNCTDNSIEKGSPLSHISRYEITIQARANKPNQTTFEDRMQIHYTIPAKLISTPPTIKITPINLKFTNAILSTFNSALCFPNKYNPTPKTIFSKPVDITAQAARLVYQASSRLKAPRTGRVWRQVSPLQQMKIGCDHRYEER